MKAAETHVPDERYNDVGKHFNEKKLADLTLAITTINAWNRSNIAARTDAGTNQVRKAKWQKTA